MSKNKYLYGGKELQDERFGLTPLNLYDFGARFYNPKTGGWYGTDLLAEKYYSISPYVYCANNPIKFVDPTGMWIAGTDGKAVVYTNSKWSENTSADVKRVGNSLLKTETGTSRLSYVLSSEDKTSIKVLPDVVTKTNADGQSGFLLGNKITDSKEMADGSLYVKGHTIEIYEGSIKSVTDAETGILPYKGVNVEDAIGAVAGHEFVHTEPENTKQSRENLTKGTRHDVEKKPIEVELKILEELKNK